MECHVKICQVVLSVWQRMHAAGLWQVWIVLVSVNADQPGSPPRADSNCQPTYLERGCIMMCGCDHWIQMTASLTVVQKSWAIFEGHTRLRFLYSE